MSPAGAPVEALRAVVRGRVQGVGFRWSAVAEARRRGIRGTVANMPDGSVEVWAEGDPAAVETFLAWLRRGPPGARVGEVQVERHAAPRGFDGFEVAF